jgi:uncharacterized cupin superfamily protein
MCGRWLPDEIRLSGLPSRAASITGDNNEEVHVPISISRRRGLSALGQTFFVIVAMMVFNSSRPAEANDVPPWIRADGAMLAGRLEIVPPEDAEKGLPRGFFDELLPAVDPKFGAVHFGPTTTSVFQTKVNISRSFDFPGDEVVRVMSGTFVLIDDPTGRTHTFERGANFIVPRHWKGLWIFHNQGSEAAREFVTLSTAEWSQDRPPLDRRTLTVEGKSPGVISVDLHRAESELAPMNFTSPGRRWNSSDDKGELGYVIFAGEPSFVLLKSVNGTEYSRAKSRCETTVRVIAGTLSLEDGHGQSDSFRPEDVVVLTPEFQGKVRLSAGFSALSTIGAGRADLDSSTVVSAVNICPAI